MIMIVSNKCLPTFVINSIKLLKKKKLGSEAKIDALGAFFKLND